MTVSSSIQYALVSIAMISSRASARSSERMPCELLRVVAMIGGYPVGAVGDAPGWPPGGGPPKRPKPPPLGPLCEADDPREEWWAASATKAPPPRATIAAARPMASVRFIAGPFMLGRDRGCRW